MVLLRSLIFSLVFYTGSLFYVLSGTLAAFVSRPLFEGIVRGWCQFHYVCARWILGIKVRVEGQFADHPVIYAVKHEAMFETVDLPRLLHRPAIPAKQELFRIPLWGRLLGLYGMIPVARDDGAKAMRALVAAARTAVADGRPIVIFPEGTRIPHGACPPIKPGIMGLYRMLDLPIVPIAVDSGRLCPRHAFLKRSGTIRYRIGTEIPAGLTREEAMARLHRGINALNRTDDA